MNSLSSRELVEMAPDYPFEHPRESFLFVDGAVQPLDAVPWSPADRVAVVAYGSNRSPDVLRRKYAGHRDVVIPTLRAEIRNFDVVYAAMISTLGPVPATFLASEGAIAEVAVQFFTEEQLRRMHESERAGVSYDFAPLPVDAVEIDGQDRIRCFSYFCMYGALRYLDEPVALQEVTCHGRRWNALSQRQILEVVRRRIGSSLATADFLVETIADEELRRQRIALLSSTAFRYVRAEG